VTPTRIEFDLTAEDAAQGNAICLSRDPVQSRQRARLRWGVLAVLFLGGVLSGLITFSPGPPELAGAVIAALFVLAAWTVWPTERRFRRQVAAVTRRRAANPADRRALGPRTYELRPDCLRVEASHLRSELFWDGVVATYRTRDYFVVVFPGPAPATVPREVFATDDEFDAFADEAERLIVEAGGAVGDPADDEG
jgi:hypothetical protein